MSAARRGAHAVDTRGEILAHALDLFGSGGYASTTLGDIAERMGFSKAALYYHYRTKDRLLGDLFGPVIAEGDAIVARERGAGDEALGSLLRDYFGFLWRHRVLLCHVACDLAVLATAEGARVVEHVDAAVSALARGSRSATARIRAKAALGALQGPITLAEPDATEATTRRVAVAAALAVLTTT